MSKFSHIIEQTAYSPCDKLLSLLSLATSPNNTKRIYTLYLTEPDRTLFGWNENEEIVGCIGIKRLSNGEVVILHLAVLTHFQSRGIGSAMINFIRFLELGATLTAETDREAVGFSKMALQLEV